MKSDQCHRHEEMRTAVTKEKQRDKNTVVWRLKRGGLRFELLVFRDKIPSPEERSAKGFAWRFTELLSVPVVFANAMKNELAKQEDKNENFGTVSEEQVFKEILEKGELLHSQEDKNEAIAGTKHQLREVAEGIAKRTAVLPEDPNDRKGNAKRDHFTSEIIERELKNIRFKPPQNASLEYQVIDGIGSIRLLGSISILRDAVRCSVAGDKQNLNKFITTLEKDYHEYVKIVARSCDSVSFVADPVSLNGLQEAAAAVELEFVHAHGTKKGQLELHWPKDVNEDLTDLRPALPGAEKEKQPTKKQKPPEKTGKEPTGSAAPAASATAQPAAKKKQSLEEELLALQLQDDDDDAGRKKKPAKKPKAPPPPAKQTAPTKGNQLELEVAGDDEEDSEENTMMKAPRSGKKRR